MRPPLLTQAINDTIGLSQRLDVVAKALTEQVFSDLINCGFVREIEGTVDGIVIHPIASPHDLRCAIQDRLPDLEFSRMKDDDGVYQWVSTYQAYDVQVIIMANECIDLTGTLVTDPKYLSE